VRREEKDLLKDVTTVNFEKTFNHAKVHIPAPNYFGRYQTEDLEASAIAF
jgi:hypothetical protein